MYNKPFDCVCHSCGKKYVYFPNNPDGNGLRRCAECLKLKHVKWKCTCGEEFDTRDQYYNHRRENRLAGKPCNKRVQDSECPFCKKPIGSSHNIYALTECWMNHKCDGVYAIENAGGSLRFTMDVLKRLKNRSSIRNETIDVSMDKMMQLMWVKSLIDKTDLTNDFILSDTTTKNNQLVVSFANEMIFIFDDCITNKLKVMFTEMHWCIFNLKWTDCIKDKENVEKQLLEEIEAKKCITIQT